MSDRYPPNQAKRLRELLAEDRIVVAPGAGDALMARLVEQAGFPAVYMTGFAATASRLGCPDIGLLTQTEMTTHARDMVRAVSIPVIADADTGYGGIANIERTIREYQQAGVAAIHMEDQVSPKRCGQMAGVKLIPAEEMVSRLECVQAVRGDDDLVLIARTDGLAASGIDEALRRGNAYREAGADVVFVDAVRQLSDARAIAENIEGLLMISVVEGNETTEVTFDELQEMGFSIAVYALSTMLSATWAVQDTLKELSEKGTTHGRLDRMLLYSEFGPVVDLDHYADLDHRFGSG